MDPLELELDGYELPCGSWKLNLGQGSSLRETSLQLLLPLTEKTAHKQQIPYQGAAPCTEGLCGMVNSVILLLSQTVWTCLSHSEETLGCVRVVCEAAVKLEDKVSSRLMRTHDSHPWLSACMLVRPPENV